MRDKRTYIPNKNDFHTRKIQTMYENNAFNFINMYVLLGLVPDNDVYDITISQGFNAVTV